MDVQRADAAGRERLGCLDDARRAGSCARSTTSTSNSSQHRPFLYEHEYGRDRRARPVTALPPHRTRSVPCPHPSALPQPSSLLNMHFGGMGEGGHHSPHRQPSPAYRHRGGGSNPLSTLSFALLAILSIALVGLSTMPAAIVAASAFDAPFSCPSGGVKTLVSF